MAFLMIDYENVQPSLATLPKDGTKIMVFLGKTQKRVADKTRQQLGGHAEFIQIEGQGPNALDFHIAFYIGQLAAKHDGAQFVVVSNDTGFDPLIKHLCGRKISCERVSSESVKPPVPAPTDGEFSAVIENLARQAKCLPKRISTLKKVIRNVLGKQVSHEKAGSVVTELMKQGVVVQQSNGRLTYNLP